MRRFRNPFDGALKNLFQQDRSALLERIAGGVKVVEFLNVELPRVDERRVDLVLRLADGSILHIELQSGNDPAMALRMIRYYALLKDRYRCTVRQVVLFLGSGTLRMREVFHGDRVHFEYEILDMRTVDARSLLSGSGGDLALATLASGGESLLREILARAASLRGGARERALGQILVLAGLRGMAQRVESEMRSIGVIIDVRKNTVLMRWAAELREEGLKEGFEQGREEGLEEGLEQGLEKGRVEVLREMLRAKFGKLPGWADAKLRKATRLQVNRWIAKMLDADRLDQVFGRRR